MRKLKSFLTIVLATLGGISAFGQSAERCIEGGYLAEAQELGYLPYPYGFIQVQGGLGTTFTDVNSCKLFTPTFSIGGGAMFSPIIGARVHVNGWKSTGGLNTIHYIPQYDVDGAPIDGGTYTTSLKKYKYNYINTNIDVMLNIFNIFSKKVHRPVDLYLIGGFGLNYAWDNSEFKDIVSNNRVTSDISNAWGEGVSSRHNQLGHNLRVGLLADINVAKNVSVGVEVDYNSLSDRFNSKYGNSDDGMITGQLSLTYKFGFKPAPAPKPVAVAATPVYQDTKQTEAVPTPAPKPVVAEEPVKETIFYALRESDVNKEAIINKVATWCKKYPNKTITIEGYADKGTGNPKLNAGYAQLRAEKVAAALQQKGVPASQMNVKSYGDTVQPFTENDKNRCVIIEGK